MSFAEHLSTYPEFILKGVGFFKKKSQDPWQFQFLFFLCVICLFVGYIFIVLGIIDSAELQIIIIIPWVGSLVGWTVHCSCTKALWV